MFNNQKGIAHLLAIIILLVITIGLVAGLYILKQSQDNRSRAAWDAGDGGSGYDLQPVNPGDWNNGGGPVLNIPSDGDITP